MLNIPEALQERYNKPHLSYSSLKVALTDMAKFDQYMKGELKFQSPALTFGTLYDMLLFERDKAFETYSVVSDEAVLDNCSEKTRASKGPKLTKEYKEMQKQLIDEAAEHGKTLCSPADWKMANQMIDRLERCGLVDKYLSSGKYQVEFNEQLGPIRVKGFLDCLGDGFIVDSKSTKAVDKFRYSVRDFSYDIQAYIYCKRVWCQEVLLARPRKDLSISACSGRLFRRNPVHWRDEVQRCHRAHHRLPRRWQTT